MNGLNSLPIAFTFSVCVCVRACMRACVRACVRVSECMHACTHLCVCVSASNKNRISRTSNIVFRFMCIMRVLRALSQDEHMINVHHNYDAFGAVMTSNPSHKSSSECRCKCSSPCLAPAERLQGPALYSDSCMSERQL